MTNSSSVEAQYAKAVDLHRMGRIAEALAQYDAILRQYPQLDQVHYNRSVALASLQRLDEALASYQRTIELNPAKFEALRGKGEILHRLGRFEEALQTFQQTIRVKPDFAEAHYGKGMALNDLQRYEEALRSFEQASKFRADYIDAVLYQGIMLVHLQRFEEASRRFEGVIESNPNNALAHCIRAKALQQLEHMQEAIDAFDRSIALRPNYLEAFFEKANTQRDIGLLGEALATLDRLLAFAPEFADAHNNRANLLQMLGRFDEALAAFDRAIALKDDFIMAHYNKSFCLLLLGKFEQGWPEYEWRKRHFGPVVFPDFGCPVWDGREDLAGRSLFVHFEQGLGDTIMFCRYAALAAERGAKVTLLAPDMLVRLLKDLSPGVTVVANSRGPSGTFDLCAPLISLPKAFGTNVENIPATVPYLRAEPELVAKWGEIIGDKGFKIGIAWQGNRKAAFDTGRSLALSNFANLAAIPGVRLISLQKGDGTEQIADVGFPVETLGEDFDSGPDAFIDTAAVMANLDLVISSDTAIAHLAGALGRPTWVALRRVPEWRWFLERNDSPWYPGMRLFRQPEFGDWASVFAAMEQQLRSQLDGTPRISLSWGELIDKISILEIKNERLHDKAALSNVRKELALLREAAAPAWNSDLNELAARLRAVNEKLWDIEDDIRAMEAQSRFDGKFIELARSVYKTNDARSAIKRQINDLLGSAIVEEKSYKKY